MVKNKPFKIVSVEYKPNFIGIPNDDNLDVYWLKF